MKRVWTVFLAVALLTGTLSVSAAVKVVGDVNGDGRVNNRDVGHLQQYLSDWDVTAVDADLNGDGRVNNRDMALLQQTVNEGKGVPMYAAAATYTNLGAPAASYFPNNLRARCAWDMTIHDGRLYVGSGDYDKNTGFAPVLSAPLSDPDNWSEEAILPDEQVGRFVDYNGVLTIPGYDPVGNVTYGNYYEKIDGVWQTVSTLPYALHNFDIAWFEGQLFASVGAPGNKSPIVVTDNGVDYHSIPLYRDGEPVVLEKAGVSRSMNLYVLGGTLYADLWYYHESLQRSLFEMYRYNPELDIMEYVVDMKTVTHGGQYSPAGLPLWEKELLGNTMFFTTGYLYCTTDFEDYTAIAMPNNAMVYDMMEYGGRMYILAAYQSGTEYKTTVYSVNETNPTLLRTETSFSYALPPTAFAVDADSFFIGMGNWYDDGSAGNGTILQFQR